jgi:hypothetical protein
VITPEIIQVCVALKGGTVWLPPLTVTTWDVGLKLIPLLVGVGVTVYVPLGTLLKL